jgi:hypothetical protein
MSTKQSLRTFATSPRNTFILIRRIHANPSSLLMLTHLHPSYIHLSNSYSHAFDFQPHFCTPRSLRTSVNSLRDTFILTRRIHSKPVLIANVYSFASSIHTPEQSTLTRVRLSTTWLRAHTVRSCSPRSLRSSTTSRRDTFILTRHVHANPPSRPMPTRLHPPYIHLSNPHSRAFDFQLHGFVSTPYNPAHQEVSVLQRLQAAIPSSSHVTYMPSHLQSSIPSYLHDLMFSCTNVCIHDVTPTRLDLQYSTLDAFMPTLAHTLYHTYKHQYIHLSTAQYLHPKCRHTSQYATSTYLRVCILHTYNLNIPHSYPTSNLMASCPYHTRLHVYKSRYLNHSAT